MKTKALLATLLLAFTSAVSADDTLEANVTFMLKVHEQYPAPVAKGNFAIESYQTITLKNYDIIQMIAEKEASTFTKKAKIILQITYDEEGLSGYSYLIREKGQDDLIVTAYIEDLTPLSVYKAKSSITKGTGTATQIGMATLDVAFNGDFEGLYLTGPYSSSIKFVQSPSFPEVIMQISRLSMNLAGDSLLGTHPDTTAGYATGTFKVSGMKILK